MTGAIKGIITLRDRMTAEIFISQDMRYELSSPLLYGFSEDEIESYISHYAQFDPWTEVEKLYHPISPYELSKYVDQKTLRSSLFWQWLEPQGISDVIVLDIGTSANYWVAMNLFFPAEDHKVKQAVLDLTREFQKVLQDAWRCGLQYRATKFAPESLSYFIEQQQLPSLLLDVNGVVVMVNEKANALLVQKQGLFLGKKNNFYIKSEQLKEQFNHAMIKLKDVPFSINKHKEVTIQDEHFLIKLTLIEKPENVIGEDVGLRLITIESIIQQDISSILRVWDNTTLSLRERQLVELIAKGGKVVDFINQYGITKSTGHFHWTNVKAKLNVSDRSEIYAQHQVFLQNL